MEITESWTRKFPPRERGNRPKNGEISSNFSNLFSEFQLSTDFSYRPNSANVKKFSRIPRILKKVPAASIHSTGSTAQIMIDYAMPKLLAGNM